MKLETLLARAGLIDKEPTGAVSAPIYMSATFRHPEPGVSTGFDYSRTSNPTRQVLEETLAALEGGARGLAFSTGMAAITAALSLFSSGDHLVVSEDLYGGTYRLFDKVFSRFGLSADFVDTTDPRVVETAIKPSTKALFIENPSNPLMKISPMEALADLCRKKGLLCLVDNTFMTPCRQKPLDLGADIVIHSGTKYLGGHNDLLSGVLVAADEGIGDRLAFIQNSTGAVLSPLDSWLLLRGLKTLAVRFDRVEENAGKIARWLAARPDIGAVYWPGLDGHPGSGQHGRQSFGPGAMLSFRVANEEAARRVIGRVRVISFAESLGGVESLITWPAVQTHADIPAADRNRLGVTGDLLRLSAGIENSDDLIADLDQALGSP
jgi:cystathionine beta-lyase/cystathionine gamma-synthase